ncbi:hypothetical protein HQ571_00130 [Candidatus Kuenenbacteria bacterium]|nr:hypothetical protein [Candidatus Kuenenbacteria bacterium]
MEHNPIIRNGWIEVITGCVFSGKSDEGSKRITKECYAKGRNVLILTPNTGRRKITICHSGEEVDTKDQFVSRAGKSHPAFEIPHDNPEKVFELLKEGTTTVVFEEAQFFNKTLIDVCHCLATKYKLRVIVIGLDKDLFNRGFGSMPELMIAAESVKKELATCLHCGSQNANSSWLPPKYWKELKEGNILPGDAFEPACRSCYSDLKEEHGLPQL